MAGGWRIIETMGQRITKLTPFGGFSAEATGALTLLATAKFGIPVSTTELPERSSASVPRVVSRRCVGGLLAELCSPGL
jgi:phosphate/sulfate permease